MTDPFSARVAAAAAKPGPNDDAAASPPSKKRLTIDLADPAEYEALRRWAFESGLPMTRLLRGGAVLAASDAAARARIQAIASDLH